MPFIERHPAPGFGELTPGWWVVPNNPFQPAKPLGRVPSVGEILPAAWTLPQNPLREALATVGLPDGVRSNRGHLQGLGDVDLNALWAEWSNPSQWTLKNWSIIGAGLLVLLMMSRRDSTAYKAAKYKAKADYYSAIIAARKASPTLASRAYEALRRR